MAISPLSDIVLEVARAADPTKYRAAAARLGERAAVAGPQSETFREALDGMRAPAPARMPPDPALALVRMQSNAAMRAESAKPYEQFEAFVLQTFIQSMLPRDGEALFGAGTAGEIWKSMLAEGLGAQLARTGGIGIAAMLAGQDSQAEPAEGVDGGPAPTRS